MAPALGLTLALSVAVVWVTDDAPSVSTIGAAAPAPLKRTLCSTSLPEPFITQVPCSGPTALGANTTSSVRISPGAIVVPSDSEVVALKAPPVGGLDFVMVMVVPPVLATVKIAIALAPTATGPTSFVSLLIWSTPGGPALPERRTASSPPLVSRPSSSLNAPTAVGLNSTVIVIAWPGSIVEPTSGAPLTSNGAAGRRIASIVSGSPPTLRKVAPAETCSPTLVAPKVRTGGEASSLAAGSMPVPDSENVDCFAGARGGRQRRAERAGRRRA